MPVATMPAMPRKKTPKKEAATPFRQAAFRADSSFLNEVEEIGKKLGLDFSNFMRMILVENIARYRRRAEELKDKSIE